MVRKVSKLKAKDMFRLELKKTEHMTVYYTQLIIQQVSIK